MKLIDYMPQYLKDVREFQEIFKSEDNQLNCMNTLITQMLTEVIVNSADSYGLERYEKIYNISNISKNIEERRFNILSKMNDRLPFTLNWLRNKLENLVGKNNYRIKVQYDEYSITIDVAMIFEDIANTLNISLREQLPANLKITVNLFQTEKADVFFGAIMRQGDFIRIGGV